MFADRKSPKKPFIAAFATALGLSVVLASGYRKYKPAAPQLSAEDAVRVFFVSLPVLFLVFYALRMLGVHMGPMGGREDLKTKQKHEDS